MRKLPLALAVLLVSSTPAVRVAAAPERLQVSIGGADIPAGRIRVVAVDSEVGGVDAATVALDAKNSALRRGDAVRIAAFERDDAVTLFTGEVVGIEPVATGPRDSRVVIRAFNKMHRLTRGRKSRTFENMSDRDVAARIAAENGLAFGGGGPEATATSDRIFQNNQTDLQFLKTRAAAIGFAVWVDEATLFFARKVDGPSVTLGCPAGPGSVDATLQIFHPRLASATVVRKVTVRGWDPEKKQEIVADASRPMIALSPGGTALTEPPGPSLELGLVPGLESAEASYGAGSGVLSAMTSGDLAAEAKVDGLGALRAGTTFDLIEHGPRRLGGKYLVTGASHRYEAGSAPYTLVRLVRTDRAVFVLPEIGDEVLVAFEQGDITRPYVVGSLWNGVDRAETSFCKADK